MPFTDDDFRALGLISPPTRRPLPHGPQTVAEALDEIVAARGAKEALVGRAARYTFAELDAAIDAAVAGLASRGVQPGDRIAATAKNDPDIVIAFHAAQRLGAVWVGIARPLSPVEKAAQLADCGATIYLADQATIDEISPHRTALPDLRHIVEMEPARRDSDWRQLLDGHAGVRPDRAMIDPYAPAAIGYTSGTTGTPKGVVHSQHNLMVATAFAAPPGVRRQGCPMQLTIVNVMMNHGLGALRNGTTLVCIDRSDAAGIMEWVAAEAIDGFRAPPPVIFDLLTKPELASLDLSRLVYLATSGGAASARLRALYAERLGRPMFDGYGLTEAPGIVTTLRPGDGIAEGAIGRPLPHLDVRILAENGVELPAGASGEICVRAVQEGDWADVYTPMLGYWQRPQETREALRGGWLRTGDIGRRDDGGLFHLLARRKEMILRGGANIYPAEVERVIKEDPRVRDAVVLGLPDERLGEIVVAVIESAADISADQLTPDLIARVDAKLARYKRPARWLLMPAMPRNSMGKVERQKVKAQLASFAKNGF